MTTDLVNGLELVSILVLSVCLLAPVVWWVLTFHPAKSH